jgi:8-oxo-dGTP pyrophosphatase MutT (NUDIX family)
MKSITSCGFLIRSVDKYLLCHPSNLRVGLLTGDRGWGLPKGKLDGEDVSMIDCAIREVREETSLNLLGFPLSATLTNDPIFVTSYLTRFQGERVSKTIHVFFAHDIDGVLQKQKLSCPSLIEGTNIPEMDDFRWVTKEEAKKICARSLKDLFENVEEYTK